MTTEVTLALAGDTMLGRGVADVLASNPDAALFSDEIGEIARSADLFMLNLECCVSERGEPWPAPGKPFFFRAPPAAVDVLANLGVDCVTLANNHALDFGYEALLDTLDHLDRAGIKRVGAGRDLADARAPAEIEAGGVTVTVIGATDHPHDYEARADAPGVALAQFRDRVPQWLTDAVARASGEVIVVTPHWGPNMTSEPLPEIRRAARSLTDAGASLIAGHSAHVFHGVTRRTLFDLGDFVDDYAIDPILRNDLGLLWLVTLSPDGPKELKGIPLKLDYCYTRRADGEDARWIETRFRRACAVFNTDVECQNAVLRVLFS
jgi:poly-gamma-glutamate capsule biosynthesis protein CapA/YwtB (metallophosphatase superfamily)